MGVNINEDGTKGFVKTAIRGGDLGLIAAWHGANDPTADNNKIPANGLFFNTTEHVIKLNIGTEAAPIWKSYYQFPVYGRSSQNIIIDANTVGVQECGDLTINDGVTLSGKQKQNLIIVCSGKLTINGIISMTGLGANGDAENSKNLDSHAGTSYDSGANINGGQADVYRKPNLTENQIGYGASAYDYSAITNAIIVAGGGRIIIFAHEIEFGENGKIEASGQNGIRRGNASGQGGGGGGDINIITATALTADQKAKIVYSDIAAERNGTDGAQNVAGVGGKARLTEIIV